jgi:hypothetical protein
MRNEPSNVNQGPRARTPTPPPPPPPSATNINRPRPEERSDNLHDEEDGDDEHEGEEDDGEDSMADVYSLPPPLPLAASGGGRCPRLPPAEPPPLLEGLHMDLEQTDDTPPAILLSNHMVRSEIWIRYTMVSVADPGCFSRSRIRIKEFKYCNPKKGFLSSRKYDPVVHPGSRIPILTFYPSRIPDPGVKKAPDTGSGSAILAIHKPVMTILSKQKVKMSM